jgi:hypothetical protein
MEGSVSSGLTQVAFMACWCVEGTSPFPCSTTEDELVTAERTNVLIRDVPLAF